MVNARVNGNDGYTIAKPDKEAPLATLAKPFGKWAIRGREQQLIDRNGGAQSDTRNFKGGGSSANKIRGVWYYNPNAPKYHGAANSMFGEYYKYTGFF